MRIDRLVHRSTRTGCFVEACALWAMGLEPLQEGYVPSRLGVSSPQQAHLQSSPVLNLSGDS